MDEDERQRKLDAGRAKKSPNMPQGHPLARFRQKRAKGDCTGTSKKTQKRKGQTVSPIDGSTQDRHLEPAPGSDRDSELNNKSNHEIPQKPGTSEVHENQKQKTQPTPLNRSLSPVEDFREEELLELTGKEQLKQLQQAVEKRNEIISRLSSNLQEALASRDQVQLEAQSLAGQIQALQRQLQQTSVEFLRIKSQSGSEVPNAHQQLYQHGLCTQEGAISHKEGVSVESDSERPGSELSVDGISTDSDVEFFLQKLRAELEEEREKCQCISTELAEEMEKHQHVLCLLEKEKKSREEEREEREARLQDLQTHLSSLQSQCLELQKYKEEKENLNRQVVELKRRLQEEENAARRFSEEMAISALRLQSLEEESQRQTKEMQRLKEEHGKEVERVRKELEEKEKEFKYRKEEETGMKASKDHWNQTKADVSCDEQNNIDEANLESGLDQSSGNLSISGDILMERYLSSVPLAHSQFSEVPESLEHCNQLDISADCSFELNSDIFGEEPLLSISNRFPGENDNLHSSPTPHCSPVITGDDSSQQALAFNDSTSGELETSEVSEQQLFEETDLEKVLLNQQCGELQEELAIKERELNVLREEIVKNTEELEEARASWAQVSGELRQVLIEIEDEKEKRRLVEEENAHEQDHLKKQLCALINEKENAVMLIRKETAEGCLLVSDTAPSDDKMDNSEFLSNQEESKTLPETTAALLRQRTVKLDDALKELETTRAQVLDVQTEMSRLQKELEKSHNRLESVENLKTELELKILFLGQNLEEAQAQAEKEKEQHRRKEEEMDERIKQMEQVLEEELEQFENLLKAKDVELAEEKEKWEEERLEKEKMLLSVRRDVEKLNTEREEVKALLERQEMLVVEATERLEASHQQDTKDLMEKHHREISELNNQLESKLLKLKNTMEEEQKKQISLIKQVTERDHERMVIELTAKHDKEFKQLRESMEAAHEAELQQAQVQKISELAALRLSLTNEHASQMQHSQANLQQKHEAAFTKVEASLREGFAQESAALHQSELDQIRIQNQEQQERLVKLHQQEMNELKQQWESSVAKERGALEEKQATELQDLRLLLAKDAETTKSNLQTALAETQRNLIVTQTELSHTQASLTQTNKSLTEAQATLSQTQLELQESQHKVEALQTSSEEHSQKQVEELRRAWAERDTAARALEELVCSYKATLQEKEQQIFHLEEKVLRLQEEKTLLKQSSEQEVGQLWTQLDSMRASRLELGELKEQLLARSSRVDDIERLKTEFSNQKQEIKEQNEAELESLRRYFEQRLRVTEENYREEIALLQLRLVEGALEESVLKTIDDSFNFEGQPLEETNHELSGTDLKCEKPKELLDSLRLQLEEKHTMELASLQSSMSLSFKEELQQVRSDLTDHYYEELQEMKTRHSLELEQLRAKLSDHHLQELTRVRLEAARQVEVEVEQRIWCQTEELHSNMTIIHNLENKLDALSKQQNAKIQRNKQSKQEFSEELILLEEALTQEREDVKGELKKLRVELQEKHGAELVSLRSELDRDMEKERTRLLKMLDEEKEKLKSIQAALDNNDSPQVQTIKQRLKAQFDNELQRAKSCMETEIKELTGLLQLQNQEHLREAQERFQQEKTLLEQSLIQKYEISLEELKNNLENEFEHERTNLLNKHSKEMDRLYASHEAQITSLSASHGDKLAAMAVEHESKHKAELVALEAALDSKRKADLESLEAVFRETSRAQLEALEADLAGKHQEERNELEKRMLSNMDTLESTYLKEVQTLRDKILHLEEKHHQDLNRQKSEHASDQLSMKEKLRKELARVHIEKFSAMAAELSCTHKTELAAQKEALDTEHCSVLETLKKQVLELEQQHSCALLELTQSYATEKEQLMEQHQLQLQELRGVSARELEACRRELEEESSRQRQHFLEEMELLKVQSEERLQDRINQLKTEFGEQKQAELDDLRRSFTSEQEEKERSYTGKMSQLTAQLQQLDAVVAQLQAEIGCLQAELKGKRAEMNTLDTLLQRRERESEEGNNLVKMLTDDLQTAKKERCKLDQANEKLRKVLIEMIRGTVATEELIGKKISARAKISEQAIRLSSSAENKDTKESGISVAEFSSDDLELTHQLCESLLISDNQLNPGGEEAALNACSRLRLTVDTLLELLNQANTQLEHSHNVHLSLEEKFSQGREDSAQLLEQHKLLLEQLDQQAKLKSQLQLELHKSEGLLDGYVAEKAVLEESLQQKETREERLVEELENLREKLHHVQDITAELDSLRLKHQELSEEHTLLLRQKEHLSADLGEREKALLAETERLARDRLDLQRQAEKDHSCLSLRLRALERELEEQESKGLETEENHKTHTEDLYQRVQALEKQLKHNRQFIEEQAVEREHERDEFQQEIRRLESQLRQTSSVDNKGYRFEDLVMQVENLQVSIKEKNEEHASLLAANQQAQRDLAERNEEIDKLAGRIRELEQALLNSAESNRSVSQLQQELHRAKMREKELTQDKQALEQQELSNRLQISALQSKLDETRHCYHDNTRDPTQELRDALDTAQQNVQSKEHEIEVLHGQLEIVQRDLTIKEVELKHLTLQVELLTNQNTVHVNELQEQIAALKENVSALTILKEGQQQESEMEDAEEESLPSALLQEKNHEIDHLSNMIQRLEQELENTRQNKVLEAELEDLHSQLEHLQSEIIRVREDKQEEEERLHEVISTLQAELATLGPNLHEVSDSQDGDSINPSPAPSPEPCHYNMQERRVGPNNLKQELSLTHSSSPLSLRSRLKALQSQLETVVTEKEGLERLLFTQEQEYRGHGEELGKRLKEEGERASELQGLLVLKEAELEEVKAQLEKNGDMLQQKKLDNASTLQSLKTKEQEMNLEMEALRETSLTLERQVQEVRAEMVDMEELVAEERTKIKILETVKEELSVEREALRRREIQLQEEIERLRQEVTSLRACIQDLTAQLSEKETNQEEAQKEVLTNAEVTLAEADTALRQKEGELARLRGEHQVLRSELTAVKQSLSVTTEKAGTLHEEAQTKDRALEELATDNQQLKAALQSLQEDLATQETELAYQKKELQQLRQDCYQQGRLPYQHGYPLKNTSHRAFGDIVSVCRDEASLSSPEVLRKLECSEDRIQDPFHTSVLGSRLSEISALNTTGLDCQQVKTSPKVLMEPTYSRTITPDPVTQSTHSPGSVSDNYSMVESLDTDKVCETEGLDITAPPSPLGSMSSFSAHEWASDGYGSNVSSELGARLRVELEQTERLDAQFVEYLRCRGINPTINTDSAAGSMSYSDDLLSPELQDLLKKVYQESCRILAISQCRATSTSHPHVSDLKAFSLSHTEHNSDDVSTLLDHRDKSSIPPMSWQQEKRALQETVIALRELLCRMAQQHSNSGEDHLSGQVESQLRAELEETHKQLKCAQETQQEQKNKIHSLGLAVEEGEEALRTMQTGVQELQQQLEHERAVSLRKDREEEEKKLVLKQFSEQQRSHVKVLKDQVEQDRVTYSNLRQELQIEQSRSLLLEKRLNDTQKELENERQLSTQQQELNIQEKIRLEHLLTEAESRSADIHSKLADAHRKLDEERDRCSRQMDELSRRHDADAARDRRFISDMRAQLEQERKRSEDLMSVMDKLKSELLQNKRKWEEEDKTRREDLQKQQEASARQRVAVETLKEQKQEACRALEVERERSKRHGVELTELKNKLRLLKDKEREREEQWEREKRKGRQEQMERERRQERTNNKLCELELLRQQDQHRMQELQRTLSELEREEREMATQRLSGQTTEQHHKDESSQHLQNNYQAGSAQQNQQIPSMQSSSNLLGRLLKENSELTEHVTSLSEERATLKHRLTCMERQLRSRENELTKVATETENRPISDNFSNSKLQRFYGRCLRAESYRKALIYQKRYLLLLLGGFQDCEEATLCLIAKMGVRPSCSLSSQRRPLGRFRTVVKVVIAISRMRFLTRKWNKAMRKQFVSGTSSCNGLGSKVAVLREQQSTLNSDSPPKRDNSADHKDLVSALVPPTKSPFRLYNRTYSSTSVTSGRSEGMSQDPEQSLTNFIHHLEKVQQRLVGTTSGLSVIQPDPKLFDQ
ncbi:pericentrin [Antennarius striatus]|uniref:pericentrin n=1 Tax=Antennarius striatus TaxID=241820 RepID=UPI0035B42EF4